MKKSRTLIIGSAILFSAWAASWSQEPELLPVPKGGPIKGEPSFRYQGAGSCAASACHNGRGELGAQGSEYTTWSAHHVDKLPRDPHGKAYATLFTKESQYMAKALGRKKPAHEDSLCLNCHVVPNHDRAAATGLLPENFVSDGVSCESCHGPAEGWLVEHYRPEWREKSTAQKARLGMKDTRSLVARARLCAECHVGSVASAKGGIGQDVYHDLYAASHPPLIFEFSAYHASLLHHWQDARDRDPRFGGSPDFEARAWVVGQIVSAQSSLKLLEHRASDPHRPWPEFAEMDCFACHHDLKGGQDRTANRGTKKPGDIPFRTWYYSMLPRALDSAEAKSDAVSKSIQRLKDIMERRASNRKQAAAEAAGLHEHLDRILERVEGRERLDLDRLYSNIREKDVPRVKESWDNAAQVFLSIAALENTWNDLKVTATHGNLPSTIDSVRQELRFPRGFLSPVNFDGLKTFEKLNSLRR